MLHNYNWYTAKSSFCQCIHSMQKSSSAVKYQRTCWGHFQIWYWRQKQLWRWICILHVCTGCIQQQQESGSHLNCTTAHIWGHLGIFFFWFLYLNICQCMQQQDCSARRRTFGAFFVSPAQHFLRLTPHPPTAASSEYKVKQPCIAISKLHSDILSVLPKIAPRCGGGECNLKDTLANVC